MTRSPVSRAGDRDVGEQLGRVEVLQRLIERFGGVGLARREIGVGANRLRLEPLVAVDRDRADAFAAAGAGAETGAGCAAGRLPAAVAGWRGLAALSCASSGAAESAEDGSDQKQRAGAPAKTLRP